MSFRLSDQVNPPTVYIADRSELTDRWDPDMVLFRRKTHLFKYPVRKLKSFYAEPSQYGAGERGLERTSQDDPRYIRITDIDEYGILTDGLGVTAERVEPQYILKEDDLLIARSGNTVGKAYLHKTSNSDAVCFFAGYLIRFRFRKDEINPNYVFALTQLPYYRQWVRAVQRAAGQPNINAEEYGSLEIPYAPKSVQDRVVEVLHEAYREKKKRDDEARSLLAGIDDVLLDELGIPRRPEPPNMLERRMFFRDLSELSGDRLDSIAQQPLRWELEQAIQNGRYESRPLRFCVKPIKEPVKSLNPNDIYVGLENIEGATGDYNATSDKDGVSTALRFEAGQILFPKLRPYLNKTYLAGFDGVCSTEFHIFSTSHHKASYITEFLRSRWIVGITSLLMTGNTLPRLQMSDIVRLPIPQAPEDVQERITERIGTLRLKARQLREQARADLELATRDIESLILGQGD